MAGMLAALNHDLQSLIEQARSGLVRLGIAGTGFGTGTIWHADGLILTNAHVAQERLLTVQFPDGTERPGEVVARDLSLDLAAILVEAHNLPALPLGDSRALRPGSCVVALGFPWGVEAATSGVVIGHGSQMSERPAIGREWLAVSLQLRPGHSGGALLDAHGRLVGINTIMAGPEVGLAIPVHVAKDFVRVGLRSRQATPLAA